MQEHGPQYAGAGVQSSPPAVPSLCASDSSPLPGCMTGCWENQLASAQPAPPPPGPLGVAVGGQAAVQPCICLVRALECVLSGDPPWPGRLLPFRRLPTPKCSCHPQRTGAGWAPQGRRVLGRTGFSASSCPLSLAWLGALSPSFAHAVRAIRLYSTQGDQWGVARSCPSQGKGTSC